MSLLDSSLNLDAGMLYNETVISDDVRNVYYEIGMYKCFRWSVSVCNIFMHFENYFARVHADYTDMHNHMTADASSLMHDPFTRQPGAVARDASCSDVENASVIDGCSHISELGRYTVTTQYFRASARRFAVMSVLLVTVYSSRVSVNERNLCPKLMKFSLSQTPHC